MFDGWYGKLLLTCGVLLIPGAVAIVILTHPAYIVIWTNGLTAIMLLGRVVWKWNR